MALPNTPVGVWKLVNWVITDRPGGDVYPFGPNATGQIIFTEVGEFSAHVRNPDAKLSDLTGKTTDQIFGDVTGTYFGYYGSYTLDSDEQRVLLNVHGAVAPAWVGSTQIRDLAFTDDGKMRLSNYSDDPTSVAAGADGNNILTWERIT